MRTTENEAEPHKAGRLSETVGGHKRWDSESLTPPLALTRPDRKPYFPIDLTTPIETHLQF